MSRVRSLLRDYAVRVRQFSPSARLFLAAATLAGLNAGVASVLLNLYINALGSGDGSLGRVLWAGPAGAIVSGLIAGPLIDRWGPKRSMLVGTVVAGAGAVLLLASPTLWALRLGLALASAGSVVVYIAAPPLLVRHSSPAERKHLFAVTAAAYVISTAAGSAIGGFLPALMTRLFGAPTAADAYRLALFAGALLSSLGIPLLVLVREPARSPAGAAPAPAGAAPASAGAGVTGRRVSGSDGRGAPMPGVVGRLLAFPLLLRKHRREALIIGQFVLADSFIRIGGNLFVPFFNVYFVEHLGSSTEWYGTLRSLDRVVVVVATLLAAPIAVRYGPVATITLTQLLSVPFLLAFGFAPALGLAASVFLARGALMEMTVPIRDSFLMEVTPERVRATGNAALTLVGQALAVVTIPVGARLLEAGRYPLACAIAAALYVVSALLYWSFFRAKPEAAPQRRHEFVVVPQG
ncbi:MAG: MFS transporter [Chloroflexota bacterium]|nr:MFS transporter [Chloroflexota bacterium]